MQRQIPERDWKHWRKLSERALEAFCAEVLAEAAAFQNGAGTAHSRYVALFRKLRARDQQIAEVFDAPRRSVAFHQIAAAVSHGIISRAELAEFSEETQAVVLLLLGEFE